MDNLHWTAPSWSVETTLNDRYVDYLGHVTAYRFLELLERAHAAWLAEILGESEPSFVLAEVRIRYVRELLVSDGPARLSVAPSRVTASSVTVEEELRDGKGVLHATATAVLVNWDRSTRRSTPFEPPHVERIQSQMA